MHQTNVVIESMLERYRRDGWEPRSHTFFGRACELRERQLLDELKTIAPPDTQKRERIGGQLVVVNSWVLLALGKDWYCFHCGYLEPKEVLHDERCTHCGSLLCR